jgi:hypothetical protein
MNVVRDHLREEIFLRRVHRITRFSSQVVETLWRRGIGNVGLSAVSRQYINLLEARAASWMPLLASAELCATASNGCLVNV